MASFHGKQVFKYEGELEKELRRKLEEVQKATLEKVYQELIRYIKKNVYGVPPEERDDPFYKRTRTLLDIWKISDKVYYHGGVYGGVYGGIEVDNDKFETHQNEALWQHASPIYPDISATDYVNIVNNGVDMIEGTNKHSVFGAQEAKPFWDEFLELMDDKYSDLFIKTAKEMGLQLDGTYYNEPRERRAGKVAREGRSSIRKNSYTLNNPSRSVITGVSKGEWI